MKKGFEHIGYGFFMLQIVILAELSYGASSYINDPSGDATPPYLDVVSAEIIEIGDSIQLSMTLSGDVPQTVQSGFLKYLWCLDTDRNPATGQKRNYIGSEYHIHLENYGESWDGLIVKIDLDNTSVGYIIANGSVSISGKTIKILVKKELIGFPSSFDWEIDTFSDSSSGDGANSFATMTLTTNAPQTVMKAIIVAGSGPYDQNTLWNATRNSANYAYKVLKHQDYSKDNIYYLSSQSYTDADGDGQSDVSADATYDNLKYAITSWAMNANNLVLFMSGHGDKRIFYINGMKSQEKTVSSHELSEWLYELQQSMPGRLIFIYDACYSGSFLDMKPPLEKERIIITSSSADELAWALVDGNLSFSYQLWASVFLRGKLYDSFVAAKNMMPKQTAFIDVDGNGIGNEKQDSADIVIGQGWTAASEPPSVDSVVGEQTLYGGTSATIWAKVSSPSKEKIRRVWAVVIPPDYNLITTNQPVTELPVIEMSDGDSDGIYQGHYDNFTHIGTYRLNIYAEDEHNSYSIPKQTEVKQTQESSCFFVADDLNLNICAVYQGVRYGFTMKFADSAQLSWKMDVGTFGELQSDPGNCISVGNDLKLDMCAEYQGKNYGFTMNFYLNPYDISGLYWKMDLSTFREIQ